MKQDRPRVFQWEQLDESGIFANRTCPGRLRASRVRDGLLQWRQKVQIHDLGSLEPGKIADLVITRGDLLDVTVPVLYVFIDGEQIDLANRQTRFYETYRARLLEQLEEEAAGSGR